MSLGMFGTLAMGRCWSKLCFLQILKNVYGGISSQFLWSPDMTWDVHDSNRRLCPDNGQISHQLKNGRVVYSSCSSGIDFHITFPRTWSLSGHELVAGFDIDMGVMICSVRTLTLNVGPVSSEKARAQAVKICTKI